MRVFLDASVSIAVGRALAARGLDVVAQNEVLRTNIKDEDVLAAAWNDQRIVIARDYDMAELVLRGFARAVGIVIVAFDLPAPEAEAERIANELLAVGDGVRDGVLVIEPTRVRRRPYDIS